MNKKVRSGATVVERFDAPRPTFIAPENAKYLILKERDSTPAKSMLQQAKDSGNDKVVVLLVKAQENIKLIAKLKSNK